MNTHRIMITITDHNDSNDNHDPQPVNGMNPRKLIQKEAMESGKVQWRVYLSYFAAVGYLWITGIVVFNALSAVFSIFTNVWLAEWSKDKPLQGTHQYNTE